MKHRLADKIIDFSPWQTIRGIKTVSFEEYSIRQALGYAPELPQSLAIGAILELGNWLTILSSQYTKLAWPDEIDCCQISSVPGPGQKMIISVQTIGHSQESVTFSGNATIDGHEAIRIDRWQVSLLPLGQYHDTDDLRVLAGQIQEGS